MTEPSITLNIPVWLYHTETLSIVIVELPTHELLKAIDEEESFKVIIDGVLELLEPRLKADLILSFVKHYVKSTFNVVLSNNKKFLKNHVDKKYTGGMVKLALTRQTSEFENCTVILKATDAELQFNIAAGTAASPAHLIPLYV